MLLDRVSKLNTRNSRQCTLHAYSTTAGIIHSAEARTYGRCDWFPASTTRAPDDTCEHRAHVVRQPNRPSLVVISTEVEDFCTEQSR